MRWAHRCPGKAVLSTVFAPLVTFPLAGVTYLGTGILFKLLNGFLSAFDAGIPVSVVEFCAEVVTVAVILWLIGMYCRDQRHLSRVETGPGPGVRAAAPTPNSVIKRRFH